MRLSQAQRRVLAEAAGKPDGRTGLYRAEVRTGYKLEELGLGTIVSGRHYRHFVINNRGRQVLKER